MNITIATITARSEPHVGWLLAALDKQARPGDEIELILVDFYGRTLAELAGPTWQHDYDHGGSPWLVEIVESKPKPNPWQGPHRVVSRDLHAIASARNTALALASPLTGSSRMIAFVDDRAILGDGWLERLRIADSERAYALCGPCDRLIPNKKSPTTPTLVRDERRRFGRNLSLDAPGDFFLGGNFAAPLDWLLEIGGCEEASDPIGWQDIIMGRMIKNNGRRIVFDPAFELVLDRAMSPGDSQHDGHPFPRINKFVPGAVPGTDAASYAKKMFGAQRHTSDATPDLRELRRALAAGEPWPVPDWSARSCWFDGQPIAEMGG